MGKLVYKGKMAVLWNNSHPLCPLLCIEAPFYPLTTALVNYAFIGRSSIESCRVKEIQTQQESFHFFSCIMVDGQTCIQRTNSSSLKYFSSSLPFFLHWSPIYPLTTALVNYAFIGRSSIESCRVKEIQTLQKSFHFFHTLSSTYLHFVTEELFICSWHFILFYP